MKRIVLCFDGTWQSVDDPNAVSNVVRVAQAVSPITRDGLTQQTVYYQAGVGSGGGLDSFLGGVFGVGLRNNVKRGLAFLSLNWNVDDGDEIYIFGFSRGAYTARALAGVIGAIGGIPKQEHFDQLEAFWNYYRIDPDVRNAPTKDAEARRAHIRGMCYQDVRIKCLGVWDTVGSYGVPSGLGLGGLARRFTSWTKGFHDNEFGRHVDNGLHAIAIDERRRGFPPTAWTIDTGPKGKPLPPNCHVEQVWFAGAHSNVGGSYRESGLSDLALIWMMARTQDLTGLEFNTDYIGESFWPCAACSLYNSVPGWMLVSRLRPFRRSVLTRPTAGVEPDGKVWEMLNERLHWSVVERIGKVAVVDETRYVTYKPKNLPETIPDDRIAALTPTEAEFIRACRDSPDNKRHRECVLHRELGPSTSSNRKKRIARLRAGWAGTAAAGGVPDQPDLGPSSSPGHRSHTISP